MSSTHEVLGARLAKSLGSGPGRMCVVAQEARIAEAARLGHAERRWRLPLAWAAASALIAAGVIVFFIRPTAEPPILSSSSSSTFSPPRAGRLLETTTRTAMVALEDGSALSSTGRTPRFRWRAAASMCSCCREKVVSFAWRPGVIEYVSWAPGLVSRTRLLRSRFASK